MRCMWSWWACPWSSSSHSAAPGPRTDQVVNKTLMQTIYILISDSKSSLNDPKKTDDPQDDDEEEDGENGGAGDEEEGGEEEGDEEGEESGQEEGEEEEGEEEDEPPTTRSQARKRRPRKD